MTEHQPYEQHNGAYGVKVSYILKYTDKHPEHVEIHPASVGFMSFSAYKQKCVRGNDFRLKEGRGAGNVALVRFEALTREQKAILKDKFGAPDANYHPLDKYFEEDGEAKRHYQQYYFGNESERLTEAQINLYTLRASMLNALAKLRDFRFADRKKKSNSTHGVWETLKSDVHTYDKRCLKKYGYGHGLPNSDKLRQKLNEYLKNGTPDYDCLIDGRAKNNNAQTATPEMIELWTAIYGGQKGIKPNHAEVWMAYDKFLAGKNEIVSDDNNKAYDFKNSYYKPVSERTVLRYQAQWAISIGTHYNRAGDRQKYRKKIPYQQRRSPQHAGVIISVDDRQPAFLYAPGKRMWFYLGIDVGSQAITAWAWADKKEKLIEKFYRQMVANYVAFDKPLPYELEGEMSLNSSFTNTFLANGAMFNHVRIEANNARGKIIERFFKEIRYRYEKKYAGFVARPHARDEANQQGKGKQKYYSKNEIVTIGKEVIQEWNNDPHTKKEFANMTRWEVFELMQHPKMMELHMQGKGINWHGILPHLGKTTPSSMRAGYVQLQEQACFAGHNGEVALGSDLISIMSQIEGKNVEVKWMDKGIGKEGEVLKAFVYKDGKYICELLTGIKYAHGVLERTEDDPLFIQIQSAYQTTVDRYAQNLARSIDKITILEKPKTVPFGGFVMPGLETYESPTHEVETLPAPKKAAVTQPAQKITSIEDDY